MIPAWLLGILTFRMLLLGLVVVPVGGVLLFLVSVSRRARRFSYPSTSAYLRAAPRSAIVGGACVAGLAVAVLSAGEGAPGIANGLGHIAATSVGSRVEAVAALVLLASVGLYVGGLFAHTGRLGDPAE